METGACSTVTGAPFRLLTASCGINVAPSSSSPSARLGLPRDTRVHSLSCRLQSSTLRCELVSSSPERWAQTLAGGGLPCPARLSLCDEGSCGPSRGLGGAWTVTPGPRRTAGGVTVLKPQRTPDSDALARVLPGKEGSRSLQWGWVLLSTPENGAPLCPALTLGPLSCALAGLSQCPPGLPIAAVGPRGGASSTGTLVQQMDRSSRKH